MITIFTWKQKTTGYVVFPMNFYTDDSYGGNFRDEQPNTFENLTAFFAAQ